MENPGVSNSNSLNSSRVIQPIFFSIDPPIDQLHQAAIHYPYQCGHDQVLWRIVCTNNFKMLAGQWHLISDGYFSWKEWGRLSQTCHALSHEFDQRMSSKLLHGSQLIVAKNPGNRAVLLNEFQDPGKRVAPHILINHKDILYIQQELNVNCGPNALIDIKKGQITIEEVRQRLQAPTEAVRSQFHYIKDKYFPALQKYCVDGFLLIETLALLPPDAVTSLARLLTMPEIQSILDHIALEINYPVHVPMPVNFFHAIQQPEIQDLLEADVIGTAQLLTMTLLSINALGNSLVRLKLLQGLISVDQVDSYARSIGLYKETDAFKEYKSTNG